MENIINKLKSGNILRIFVKDAMFGFEYRNGVFRFVYEDDENEVLYIEPEQIIRRRITEELPRADKVEWLDH